MSFSTILTSEQAALLYDLVMEHRAAIVAKRCFGVWDGLRFALMQIDRGGGARLQQQMLDYGDRVLEAAIIPAATYIAWPGVKSVPGPFWDLAAMLPELSVEHHGQIMVWRPVTIYRATSPLAIVPLVAAVVPADRPLQGYRSPGITVPLSISSRS